MTQRLTDDEIAKLRERTRIDAASHFHLVARDTITALLDEIEERRRIDARRLADAEQAFREECELAAKTHNHLLDDLPWKTHKPTDQLPSAIGVPLPTATWTPKGKDGGA